MTNTFFKLFRSRVPLATLAAICFLLGGLTTWAQTAGTASVSGTITDQTGAIVSNASVTLTNTERGTSRSTVTDQTGLYSIPNVPVGPYSLKVTANGFQTSIRQGTLEVGNSLTINVPLTVGAAAAEQVEVIATGAAVETETSTFKQVIDSARITEMPLNGRQATQLVLISGGAVNAPSGDMVGSKNYASSVVINVAGGQGNYNNYMLDGGSYTDVFTNVNLPYPFPDALREFSVESNSLPARNGLHPGALVNGVTVSGTNQFHGTAFEFIRNNIINSKNFFSGKDTLKRNQFGGTFGGAIKHDKLFFFGGYQGTRVSQMNSATHACLPTTAELAGDFSQMGGNCPKSKATTIDPVSGADITTTHKLTSTSEISAQAVALANMLPLSSADQYGYYAIALPANNHEDQYIGRVDYTINASQSTFARYFITSYKQPSYYSPTNLLLTITAGNDERVQSATAGHVWTINPHVVNTFTATWARRRNNRAPTAGGTNAKTALGVNIYEYVPQDMRIAIGGVLSAGSSSSTGFSVGCGTCTPGFFNTWTEGYNDDLEWSHGKHEIALGVELLRIGQNATSGYIENGYFNFLGTGSGNGKVAEPMIDFITGTLSTNGSTAAFSQSGAQKNAYRQTIFGAFAQDTFHLTNRITVNAGIRWDPNFFQQDKKGRGANFSLDNLKSGTVSSVYTYAPAGALFYGDKGVSKSFTNNQYSQFSPRLGVTFDPNGKGKTVIRAGAAIMYDSPALYTTQRSAANAPFATEIDLTGTQSFANPWAKNVNPVTGATAWNPYPLDNPPTSSSVFPLYAFYVMVPQTSKMPTVYQWTASIQQDLGKGWNLSLNYLGNENAHLWLGQAFNAPVYIPGNSTGVAGSCGSMTTIPAAGVACSTANTTSYYARSALTLLNPKYGSYYSYSSPLIYTGGTSSYNGLIAAIQHRMSHNYSVLVNYTYSHAIDTGDANGDIASNTFMVPSNPRLDRAAAGFDIRHIFNATVVASSNFKLQNRALRIAANGWQIAPLIRILSGAPYNVTDGTDISLTGMGNDRPNVVPGVSYTTGKKVTQSNAGNRAFFNAAAFTYSTVSAGSFGNAGRNILRGPNYYDVDASLSRAFKVYGNLNMNLRIESFNLFNHPFFNSFTTTVNSSSFGYANATADPRLMQAAVKFNF
jgi:hypothetical protein